MGKNTLRIMALVICCLTTQITFAKKRKQYYTPITAIDSLMAIQPKPVVLLIATEKCNFCIIEDFSIKQAVDHSKNDTAFYYVYFDAKSKDPVTLGGITYNFKSSGVGSGVHELASVLTGQYLPTYPTILVWDDQFKLSYFREGLIQKTAVNKLVNIIQSGNGKVEF